MTTSPARLPREDDAFPAMLTEIPDPPRALYYRGRLPPKDMPALAIVGTRRASPTGKAAAASFAHELACRGFAIVSGLAFGIDAAAHEGSLEAGGYTAAVLPCGLDAIYPRSHENLAEKIIAKGGALFSEYPPGTEALPYRFLERNRIVSGLARGALIIEAPERSGALATARFAAEQGRDVFVVPGRATDPNFEGSHGLIRKGAELVTKPGHILEAFGIPEADPPGTTNRIAPLEMSPEEAAVFGAIRTSPSPLDIDKIIRLAKLQPQAVNIALTMLLIQARIREVGSGYMVS